MSEKREFIYPLPYRYQRVLYHQFHWFLFEQFSVTILYFERFVVREKEIQRDS